MKASIILIFYLLALQACIKEDTEINSTLKPGDKVPAFTIEADDGSVFTSEKLQNKISVIIFFNTNCSDCKRELPDIETFYQSVKDVPVFNFIAISRGQTSEDVRSFFSQNNITIPFFPDPERKVYSLFAQSIIPRVYLIDKKGIIIWEETEDINWTRLSGHIETTLAD